MDITAGAKGTCNDEKGRIMNNLEKIGETFRQGDVHKFRTECGCAGFSAQSDEAIIAYCGREGYCDGGFSSEPSYVCAYKDTCPLAAIIDKGVFIGGAVGWDDAILRFFTEDEARKLFTSEWCDELYGA